MAVIGAKRLREMDGESETEDGDGPTKRSYTVPFLVVTNDLDDGPQTIAAWFDANVFTVGDPYALGNDVDLFAYAHRLRMTRRSRTPLKWDVDVVFSTRKREKKDEQKDDGTQTDDPLEVRLEISIDDVVEMRPCLKAIYRSGFVDGGAAATMIAAGDRRSVCNSAGDAISDPVPEREEGYSAIRIVKRFSEWDEDLWKAYRRKVNSESVRLYLPTYGIDITFPALSLRVASIKSSGVQWTNRIRYWPVEFVLLWKNEEPDEPEGEEEPEPRETWRHLELDRGFKRAAGGGEPDGRGGTISGADIPQGIPEQATIEDLDGNLFQSPVNLDGKGQPLPLGATPIWIEWSLYAEKDLQPLLAILNQELPPPP